MAKIARRVLDFRERKRRGGVMRPSTFAEIEREAAASGARDPRAVAGAAYWKTLAAKYRGNPSSVYGMAVHLGYPYLRGEGRAAKDGTTWLSRVTKTADGTGPALFIGWNQLTRKWVVEPERQGNNPSPKYQVIAVRKGGTLGQTIDVEFVTLKKAKEYAKTIDRDVFKKPVITVKGGRNPDEGELSEAEDLYKTFHGRDPREVLELTESAEERGEYTGLGDLVELTIDAPNGDRVVVNFKDDGVRLASSPEGTQLYLLGGNQDISGVLGKFGADTSKDLIDLGELKQLVYDAAKWQTDFTPQEWKHDLGEESGVRPRTFFDQLKKRIFFAGGTYRVKRPGIVD